VRVLGSGARIGAGVGRAVLGLSLPVMSAAACAPERFVPREPGLEILREGATVRVEEREGDPAKGETTRYSVRIESRDTTPTIARASAVTSGTRCAPGAVPLASDEEIPRWHALHAGTFGVTVPGGTTAPALDLLVHGAAEPPTCMRVPVEGDEIAWRRVHPAWGGGGAYAAIIPVSRVAGTNGLQVFQVEAMRWWGIVRGTAFLGGGAAYCGDASCGGQPHDASPHVAMITGVGVDAHASLGRVMWLGVGPRYSTTLAWTGNDGRPQLLHGLFGVASVIFGPTWSRLHGEPVRPGPTAFEIDFPVGLWTTTPGTDAKGAEHSLALGVDLALDYSSGEW
jgi:hypothetical protein